MRNVLKYGLGGVATGLLSGAEQAQCAAGKTQGNGQNLMVPAERDRRPIAA